MPMHWMQNLPSPSALNFAGSSYGNGNAFCLRGPSELSGREATQLKMWDLETACHNACLLEGSVQGALGELWFHQSRLRNVGNRCNRHDALQRARGYLISRLENAGKEVADDEIAWLHTWLNRVLDAQNDWVACRSWAEKCIARGVLWKHPYQRPGHFVPGLKSQPWHCASHFELCWRLESSYESIKAELLALLGISWGRVGERATHDGGLISAGEWHEVVLLGDSEECFANRQRCPATSTALASRPEAVECARLGVGEALFSLLKPRTKLRTHCGPTNIRLTCHLGLIIPEGCHITAGDQAPRTWKEGKCLVFDDSFEHSVENNSDQNRIILLVNFWHPGISPTEWPARASRASGTA